jgi:hypothetical protein
VTALVATETAHPTDCIDTESERETAMLTLRKLSSYGLAAGILLFTSGPASAQTLVKVECQGSCNNVTLGEACGGTGFPRGISCDAVANPGAGTRQPCGINGASCIPDGNFFASDRISRNCSDTSGNDAVVLCF